MSLYLIAYDISNTKQRNRIADKLSEYGERINLSVFECRLTTAQYRDIKKYLSAQIDNKTDSIRIYPICKNCYAKSITIGKQSGEQSHTNFL